MIILSHRGYWMKEQEKNQEAAFVRSFDLGFGTETDVRDRNGRLVISHDMPQGDEMELDRFLDILAHRPLPLAINIKADGLALPLQRAMRARAIADWFAFDMAIPDMRSYLGAGAAVFTRMSEVEQQPAWLEAAAGIWLDAFSGTWYDAALVEKLLSDGKRVCVASPELHGRDPAPLWRMLRPLSDRQSLMICTDQPVRAREFFGTSQ